MKRHTIVGQELDELKKDLVIRHLLVGSYGQGEDKSLWAVVHLLEKAIYYAVEDRDTTYYTTVSFDDAVSAYNEV